MSFNNKVVLITGASSGIGAETAEAFAKEGELLSIVGRNEDRLKQVAQKCQSRGAKVLYYKADISEDEQAKNAVTATIEAFGQLDVLVNNAGFLRYAHILDDNMMESFDEVMKTNLRALILMTNLCARHLVATTGNVINVSSALSKVVLGSYMPYSVTKAGVDHFSRHAALQLAPHGVRVNTVNPGPVVTPIFDVPGAPHTATELGKQTALEKASECAEIANLILYMASDKAKSITGSHYFIDNGLMVKS